MVTVNDFFCGAGGFGLGFKNAGFRLSGAWDFDKWAVESYGNNVSPKVKQEDITQMTYKDVPFADVWTGGFPCQDISIAGKQAGMIKGETRSGLFYEFMRLLEETEKNMPTHLPKIIVLENVKGVRKYLPEIENEFAARGYKMSSTLYNSKYWNVPQNRERYFMVGVHQSIDKSFVFPKQQVEFVPKLSSVLETNVDEKYYMDNEKAQAVIEQALLRLDKLDGVHATITPDRVDKRQNGRRAKEHEKEMYTLTAQDRHGIIEPKIDVVGHLNMKGYRTVREVYDPNGLSPILTTSQGGHRQPKVIEKVQSLFTAVGDVAYCCDANYQKGISPTQKRFGRRTHIIDNAFRVRKLTPREYARLQGFPDSYSQLVSDSQFYKQMGNAVTVNVSEALAKAIKEFLEGVC